MPGLDAPPSPLYFPPMRIRTLPLGAAALVAACLSACESTADPPAPTVAAVTVSPAAVDLEPGQSVTLTARLTDGDGDVLSRAVTWTSSDAGVASVDGAGGVQALALGTTTIRATAEGVSGTATIRVVPPNPDPVTSVEVTPAAATIPVGGSVALAATGRDADGDIVPNRPVGWTAAPAGIVGVDGDGLVTGLAAGTAAVSATIDGVTGSATITVTQPQPTDGVVDVDPSRSFQTMLGWEGVAQIGQIECGPGFAGWQGEVLQRAAEELGINRVRMEVRSGHESTVNWFANFLADPGDPSYRDFRYAPVNDNADPRVADLSGFHMDEIDHQIQTVVDPLRQILAARGEELYVALCFVDFGQTSFHRSQPEEYAELVEVAFAHMQATYGWTPDALEVMLEPDHVADWEPEQVAAAAAAAGQRLAAAGYTPDLVVPSVENMANAVPWMSTIAQNATAMQYITDFSYHRYQGESPQTAAAIGTLASQLGLRTAMLEHIGADLDELWEDLTVANNSSWEQFALAFCSTPDQPHQYYDIVGGDVRLHEDNRPFLQVFPFVRRGAVRHGTTVRDDALRAMAFRNVDGTWAVIVETPGPREFTVGHLPDGTYELTYTGEDGATAASLGTATVAGGSLVTVDMPAAGVVTLFGGS